MMGTRFTVFPPLIWSNLTQLPLCVLGNVTQVDVFNAVLKPKSSRPRYDTRRRSILLDDFLGSNTLSRSADSVRSRFGFTVGLSTFASEQYRPHVINNMLSQARRTPRHRHPMKYYQ